MDFTLTIYQDMLSAFQQAGYAFFTFQEFCEGKAQGRFVILRHDVDLKAENSLATAQIENKLGIKSSYFFRVVSQSDKPEIIKAIASLGHEIGYHYEDLSLFNGNPEKAIEHFKNKLEYFRQYYPVKTICMHGSPTSKIDNRSIWEKYDYHSFGIIGEPYFDIDFNEVFYLTDTGRCWDGEKYSVRDKVQSPFSQSYHTTNQVVKNITENKLPDRIMITTHPQRWTNNVIHWGAEYIAQLTKNQIKRLLINYRK